MSVLNPRKIGPFKVKRRVGKVAFELELPEHIKIHPTISCVHLKPALPDEYRRHQPPPPIEVDGEERFIIAASCGRKDGGTLVPRSTVSSTRFDGKVTDQMRTHGLSNRNYARKSLLWSTLLTVEQPNANGDCWVAYAALAPTSVKSFVSQMVDRQALEPLFIEYVFNTASTITTININIQQVTR
ncbi:hypothetical protein G647_06428 [Cladophialophora carrionii CBS 160.54]|uniref:Tf2-1-like SH3-like domain-containing protein n=1 Tax=Cladophialophora carrionii CBS 160.54 TaxID=1279043 RepID=V9D645_9EURO|nr:uncharacterized protein G647_06428 [Cladophialophora carrionii CBS 160.54]ETI22354.1 hypothetical protein G647_06428 [Cladophialophora carrionii CBS 160.54]